MNIPIGTFSYNGVVLGSGTFKYDPTSRIYKTPKPKFLYKTNDIEIGKKEIKLLYKITSHSIIKNIKIKSFYKSNYIINKNIKIKILSKKDYFIYKSKIYNLNKINNSILKNTIKNLFKIPLKCFKTKVYNLSALNINNNVYLIKNAKNLKLINKKNIYRYSSKQLQKTKKDTGILRNSLYNLEKHRKVTPIGKVNVLFLSRYNKFYMSKIKLKTVSRFNWANELFINSSYKFIEQYKFKEGFKIQSKFIDKIILKSGLKVKCYKALSQNNDLKRLLKVHYLKTLYTTNYKEILNNKIIKELYKYPLKDIYVNTSVKLLYKNTNKSLFINNNLKYLDKNMLHKIYNLSSIKTLDKYLIFHACKITPIKLLNTTDKIISNYTTIKCLEKIMEYPIFTNKILSLTPTTKDICKNNLKTLDKIYNNPISKVFTLHSLEVIKRWWIMEPISNFDSKILPQFDYNYIENPLMVNRRDRPYGDIIKQDKHPISFMPYLEDMQGMDLHYGINEINLSIPIMLQMVNLVGYLVHYEGNQFVNCSGQESMEFILEIIFRWLNMDSTIKEMKEKGSTEHYLRCYRYLRWIAERIWFLADKDHTVDKMMGLKYAGMLFANLLDYMKNHHFNNVPLILPLCKMDVLQDLNKDLVFRCLNSPLDKKKSKRHYYIETQKLKIKNIFGE